MVTRIGESRLSVINGTSSGKNLGSATRIRAESEAQASLSAGDAAQVQISRAPAKTNSAETPGVSSYLGRREQALSAIGDIREQQLALSEKAETLATGEELSNIQSQISELQTEVERIEANSSYNGQDLLSGGVYGTNETVSDSSGYVVSVANASSLTADLVTSISTPEDAEEVTAQLTSLLSDSERLTNDTSQAQEVATATASSPSAPSSDSGDRLSVGEAEELARSISAELSRSLSSDFGGSSPTLSLIDSIAGNLSPERVSELTSD